MKREIKQAASSWSLVLDGSASQRHDRNGKQQERMTVYVHRAGSAGSRGSLSVSVAEKDGTTGTGGWGDIWVAPPCPCPSVM